MFKHQAKEQFGHLKKVLPHAAVGGLLGAGLGAAETYSSNEPLKKKVKELEGKDLGMGGVANLAQSRARLTVGEWAKKHPAKMIASNALVGALSGAGVGGGEGGHALMKELRTQKDHLKAIGKNIKDVRAAKRAAGAGT